MKIAIKILLTLVVLLIGSAIKGFTKEYIGYGLPIILILNLPIFFGIWYIWKRKPDENQNNDNKDNTN